MTYAAYRIEWTEYERGWGSRHDGSTLHRDRETAKTYVDSHWAWYRERYGNVTPDEYSTPGEAKLVEITEDQHKRLTESESGTIWLGRYE